MIKYHHALALVLFSVFLLPLGSAAVLNHWLHSAPAVQHVAGVQPVVLWKAGDNWLDAPAKALQAGYRVKCQTMKHGCVHGQWVYAAK